MNVHMIIKLTVASELLGADATVKPGRQTLGGFNLLAMHFAVIVIGFFFCSWEGFETKVAPQRWACLP